MTTTLPWNISALQQTPAFAWADEYREPGVRALFYEGLPWRGRGTRAFAWYGTPEGEGPWPAMVLVHGGGGTAFAEWVRLWTSRGYAALAMDTCGCVPVGTYANWTRHRDGGPNAWAVNDDQDTAAEDQGSYHAVADVVLGHSLLRSFPEIDPARIGITGISWGGFYTCLSAGVDARFACAMPVYGCGLLTEDSCWQPQFAEMGPTRTARWASLWDPAVYLPTARMPWLWVNGTNDFAYFMGAWQRSARLTAGPSTRCLRVAMPHGHHGPGENPAEIHVFADSYMKGGVPLATITAQGTVDGTAWARFTAAAPVVSAALHVTRDTGPWPSRAWETLPATLEDGRAHAAVPAGATAWYLSLLDDRNCLVSGEYDGA
jgi:dienelactone hydrolase